MEQQKAQTMDIDKLEVNIEEEDPWEELPGCEFDGIGMEENEKWHAKGVFEARSEEVSFMKSLGGLGRGFEGRLLAQHWPRAYHAEVGGRQQRAERRDSESQQVSGYGIQDQGRRANSTCSRRCPRWRRRGCYSAWRWWRAI